MLAFALDSSHGWPARVKCLWPMGQADSDVSSRDAGLLSAAVDAPRDARVKHRGPRPPPGACPAFVRALPRCVPRCDSHLCTGISATRKDDGSGLRGRKSAGNARSPCQFLNRTFVARGFGGELISNGFVRKPVYVNSELGRVGELLQKVARVTRETTAPRRQVERTHVQKRTAFSPAICGNGNVAPIRSRPKWRTLTRHDPTARGRPTPSRSTAKSNAFVVVAAG